jgi:hypothetical protein
MKEWFWYLSGISSVIFLQSILLNIGLTKGWIKYESKTYTKAKLFIYDQDKE